MTIPLANSNYYWFVIGVLTQKCGQPLCHPLFSTLFIYYQFTKKDGYNTKGKPVQGAIQQNTLTTAKVHKHRNT